METPWFWMLPVVFVVCYSLREIRQWRREYREQQRQCRIEKVIREVRNEWFFEIYDMVTGGIYPVPGGRTLNGWPEAEKEGILLLRQVRSGLPGIGLRDAEVKRWLYVIAISPNGERWYVAPPRERTSSIIE